MAEKTYAIYVKVLTFDPLQKKRIPVPGAKVLVEDRGFLWHPDLSDGSHKTDAKGLAKVQIRFAEEKENNLNPYFTITIPEEKDRKLPTGKPQAQQLRLPEKWETRHYVLRRVPRITSHADPGRPLEIFVGLESRLRLAYSDFHASGLRDLLALPEDTARVYLADHDAFLFIDALDPDDTLKGFGADPKRQKMLRVGDQDEYPYFDVWPTAPSVHDLSPPAHPRAWLDPPGAPVGVLGGGSFEQVGPLAADAHGFVFMVDGDAVRCFYPDGTLCETIRASSPAFSIPGGLALDQHRHLFVADTLRNRIVIFRPGWRDGSGGGYVYAGQVTGASAFTLKSPRGLAVVPHRVVDGKELLAVANAGGMEVLVFRIDFFGPARQSNRAASTLVVTLAFMSRFGDAGNAANRFQRPVGVAADRDGRLFVCDEQLHRVSRWRLNAARTAYTHEATWEKRGGGGGSGAGELDTPVAVGVDRNKGYVYVAEKGNKRVQRFKAKDGKSLMQWRPPVEGSPAKPLSVAVDDRGEVYVAVDDRGHRRVLRASVFGRGRALAAKAEPRMVGKPWTPRGAPGHMSSPAYVTYDAEGALWVSDTGNNRVLVFRRTAAGELVNDPKAGVPWTDLFDPVGLAFDPDGELFVVSSAEHCIRRYQVDKKKPPKLLLKFGQEGSRNGQLKRPRGLAVVQRTEPRLYVADRDNNRVQVLKRDGSFVKSLFLPAGFNKPEDVTADSKGRVYVADTGNKRLRLFDAKDKFVRSITVSGHGLSLSGPSGVAVDGEDRLFVTDRANNKVLCICPDGTVLAFWDLRRLLRQDAATAKIFYPELERLVVFRSPGRAVVDSSGLLAVADTGNDRVRLLRIYTDLAVNLFELGEDLPDISLRVVTKADWRDHLGLKLRVGDVRLFDDSHDFKSSPADNYSRDSYHKRTLLNKTRSTNAAVNVMKVVRQMQRWYQHHTREDDRAHRWGRPDNPQALDVDLHPGTGSFQIRDVYLGMASTTGRGPDAWDDDVIVHEMSHWVFKEAIKPPPPMTQAGAKALSRVYTPDQIVTENQALFEAWSEYARLFWAYQAGRTDRARGFSMMPGAGIYDNRLSAITAQPAGIVRQYLYLFGGPESEGEPSFGRPEKGIRNAGYTANALYQIHCALTHPQILFADSPAYWHHFNAALSQGQSKRFSDTIWRALRMFPEKPKREEWDRASFLYLRSLLKAIHKYQPEFAQMVQSIFELNNLLMPVLSITEGTSSTNPGAPLGAETKVQAGETKHLIVQITDVTGTPLSYYNLHLFCGQGWRTVLAGPEPQGKHGRWAPRPWSPKEFYSASNKYGIVNLAFTVPAHLAGQGLTVTYQPDFDHDETFAPPAARDDEETMLRKLYLDQLRTAAKTWPGQGNNWGAKKTAIVRFLVKNSA